MSCFGTLDLFIDIRSNGWGYASLLQWCLVDDAIKRDTTVVKVGEDILFR